MKLLQFSSVRRFLALPMVAAALSLGSLQAFSEDTNPAEAPTAVSGDKAGDSVKKTDAGKERVVSLIREERMIYAKFPKEDLSYWHGHSGVDLLPGWRLRSVQIVKVEGDEVFAIFVTEPKGEDGFQASAE